MFWKLITLGLALVSIEKKRGGQGKVCKWIICKVQDVRYEDWRVRRGGKRKKGRGSIINYGGSGGVVGGGGNRGGSGSGIIDGGGVCSSCSC